MDPVCSAKRADALFLLRTPLERGSNVEDNSSAGFCAPLRPISLLASLVLRNDFVKYPIENNSTQYEFEKRNIRDNNFWKKAANNMKQFVSFSLCEM